MLAKRTFKNQITIPKEIISKFGNVEYFDVTASEGRIVLSPVEILPRESRLAGIRKKIKLLGLTEGDIEGAIKWARKEKV